MTFLLIGYVRNVACTSHMRCIYVNYNHRIIEHPRLEWASKDQLVQPSMGKGP